jgi:hypothetical protein
MINPNLKDDSIILVQRVEDFYYENNNWKTYNKESEFCHNARNWNSGVISGKFSNKDEYPLLTEDNLKLISEEEINKMKSKYNPIWSPINYRDDQEILFLDLHY